MHDRFVEWPTMILIGLCYLAWLFSILLHESLGWPWILIAIVATAFHSSLQHEALHGHPTKNRLFNELLVTWGIALWLPYRRYRSLHLIHHNDANIADPHDDPESWYHDKTDWYRYGSFRRFLLTTNATLAGRLVIGPFLVLWGFCVSEFKLLQAGNRPVIKAWLIHLMSTVPIIVLLMNAGVSILFYLVVVVLPSIAIILLRSFIEHQAEEVVEHRTAVVEAGWFWSLMFLNNNLHFVHHQKPQVPWYGLPELWRIEKAAVLEKNNNYYFAGGYLEVFKKWFFRQRAPVIYPQR